MGLERTILNQIKTQIANVNGSGSYSANLSGDDQCVIGESFAPHRLPGCYIYPNGINTTQAAGRTVLTRYDRTMSVQIEALEADRSLGGNVRDIEIAANSYDGHELDRPGLGLCVLVCSISYTEVSGA